MTVVLYAPSTHKAVVFSYAQTNVEGETISIKATNVETGDIGTRDGFNTGTFTLFYPMDFTGVDEIVVTGSNGGESRGTVEIT